MWDGGVKFVGVQQNIEALFSRYADAEGLLNIDGFVEATMSMNLRQNVMYETSKWCCLLSLCIG